MNVMKIKKSYSTSDFVNASSSIVVENSWWMIDSVSCTAVGEFSKAPLFEIQLKQFESNNDMELPEGYEDGSMLMVRNRTYYVREGRPMFNDLARVWESCEDEDAIRGWVMNNWSNKLFAGHVERLTGISYTRETKYGTVVSSSKLEVWYPKHFEEGIILDDFVYLCNKGVYTPVIEEKKSDPVVDALRNLDPKVIEAILAMKK